MIANREDVVQAALIVERWCKDNQDEYGACKCPFAMVSGNGIGVCKIGHDIPSAWWLETFLRTRGLKHGEV